MPGRHMVEWRYSSTHS